MRKIKIKFGNSKIEVLYLKTYFELVFGLMFKKERNALLEFKKEGKYGIWMLFMRYPLDLVFFDRNKKMIDLIQSIHLVSLNPKTWKTYYPRKKCKYVLELDARKKLKIDSTFKFI